MGSIIHGRKDGFGASNKKVAVAASVQPIVITKEVMVAAEPQIITETKIVEIPVEKQVVIEVPVKDKRQRTHSLLVSKKVKTLGVGMDQLLLTQKTDKSESQMQLSGLRDQIRSVANSAAKHQMDLMDRMDKLGHDLDTLAGHKPNVTEVRHVETQKIHKGLVILNILLLASVLVLLCK